MKKEVKEILDKLIDGKNINEAEVIYLFNESEDTAVKESIRRTDDSPIVMVSKIIEYKRKYFQLRMLVHNESGVVTHTVVKEIKYHES